MPDQSRSGFFIHESVFSNEVRKKLKTDNPLLADIPWEGYVRKAEYGIIKVERMRHFICGIPIDSVSHTEALQYVQNMLSDPRGHLITTPNPEFVVFSQKDTRFRNILQTADLAIPDGFGLFAVAKLRGLPFKERITGSDFMIDMVGLAAQMGKRVFLLGGGDGVAHKAKLVLLARFPHVQIVGASSGGKIFYDTQGNPCIDQSALSEIQQLAPNILFVAFGQGIQEKCIAINFSLFPSVRVAMGFGGAFDFLSGNIQRAPKFLRNVGLEWLWRLILQPSRWRRIWNAVVVFPYLAFTEKRDRIS